jgi:di/tricarboxylate transporter
MDLAGISLAALVLTILVSCTTRVNPGLLAIVLAWLLGAYVAPAWGTEIGLKGVLAGFPVGLFLTLSAVTLLFSLAEQNGTLDQTARVAVGACRGNVGLVPVMFFLLALGIATIGAGTIASAAIVVPMAMAAARSVGIPPLPMTIMVAHGAVAGSMSPFAMTGIIANKVLGGMGLSGYEWQTYGYNLMANASVALAGYLAFGGWRLFGQRHAAATEASESAAFRVRHAVTLVAIAALVVGVVGFELDVGMAAFACALLLVLLKQADETAAIRAMPWGVILMVCGVTVLAALLEKTGGIDRFTTMVARISTPQSVTGVVALLTGIVSVYSSTSGVVLPAFLPIVPKLVEQLGGGDPLAIASSMIIGSNLVDVSPLSTVGALCIAGVLSGDDRRVLFTQLLIWGLSMSLAAALVCYLFFSLP